MLVGGAVWVSGIWVVTGSIVWVVVISVHSTVEDSEVEVINKASLLLEMIVIRINITISVEVTISNIKHICLKYILVFQQVLALMGEQVSVLRLEIMGKSNRGFWCIIGVSSNTNSINRHRFLY